MRGPSLQELRDALTPDVGRAMPIRFADYYEREAIERIMDDLDNKVKVARALDEKLTPLEQFAVVVLVQAAQLS